MFSGFFVRNVDPTVFIQPLAAVEREHIERAMILSAGNVRLAAKRLGVNYRTLYRKLTEYGAVLPDGADGE